MIPLVRSLAIAASLLFTGAAIAEETKDKISWLFVQTAETAEVTSEDTLVMPVTREIYAFTDRPNRYLQQLLPLPLITSSFLKQ